MKKYKYFSQLTPKQKDKAQRFYLRAKLNLLDLDNGLQTAIISSMDIDKICAICEQLRGTKLFYYDKLGVYIPLNISELLKAN